MRSGLVALLAGESTITAIVGSRIYISNAPQGAAFPHIVINQMRSDEMVTCSGTPGLRALDFDIDCKADRSVQCETLGNAVRTFIDDYTGTAGSESIDAVIVNDESTDIEPPQDGSDKVIYTTLLDVTIQYSPA